MGKAKDQVERRVGWESNQILLKWRKQLRLRLGKASELGAAGEQFLGKGRLGSYDGTRH